MGVVPCSIQSCPRLSALPLRELHRDGLAWTSKVVSPDTSVQESAPPQLSYRASARLAPKNPVQLVPRLLHKHASVIAGCVAFTLAVGFFYALSRPHLYRSIATIAIDRDSSAAVPLNKSFASALADADDYSVSLETQVRVLQSRTLALSVIRKLALGQNAEFMREAKRSFPALPDTDPESLAVEALLSEVSVKPIKNTRVVEVSFTGRDRNLNAQIVNALVEAFIDDKIRSRYEAANRSAKFLSTQLSELRTKVGQSQQKLVTYERDHNIIVVDEKQNVVTAKLDDLNKQLTASEEDRMEKEATFQAISAGSLDRLPEGKSGEALESLYIRQAELKNEYAQATTTYGRTIQRSWSSRMAFVRWMQAFKLS